MFLKQQRQKKLSMNNFTLLPSNMSSRNNNNNSQKSLGLFNPPLHSNTKGNPKGSHSATTGKGLAATSDTPRTNTRVISKASSSSSFADGMSHSEKPGKNSEIKMKSHKTANSSGLGPNP